MRNEEVIRGRGRHTNNSLCSRTYTRLVGPYQKLQSATQTKNIYINLIHCIVDVSDGSIVKHISLIGSEIRTDNTIVVLSTSQLLLL